MKKYKFTLGIGFSGERQTTTVTTQEMGYPYDVWNKKNKDEREKALNDYYQEWIWNYIDGGWTEVD